MESLQPLIASAMDIASTVHKHQLDKGGHAYIMHPCRIACRCATDEQIIVALLHDTIEDGQPYVKEEFSISNLFPQNIKDAVDAITRREGESYMQYIKRCAENEIAKAVKILDLEDNMNIQRLGELKDEDIARLNKYKKAYKYLKGE